MFKKSFFIVLFIVIMVGVVWSADKINSPDAYYYNKGDYNGALKKARQGDAVAQWNLGLMYQKGAGVSFDVGKADKWYKLAAEQGYVNAEASLGDLYSVYSMGVSNNQEISVKWYRLAAEHGHAEAQSSLAHKLIWKGDLHDCEGAMKLFKLSAQNGNVDAQSTLGFIYSNGHLSQECFADEMGISVDYKEAVKWYKLADKQGDTNATCDLAELYALGKGVKKNLSEARRLAKKGLDDGNLYSCVPVWNNNKLGKRIYWDGVIKN